MRHCLKSSQAKATMISREAEGGSYEVEHVSKQAGRQVDIL